MKQRDPLFKLYIRLKNHERKEDAHLQYRKLRNEITELTKISKKLFYKNYFEENNKNLRKIWQGIKQIINVKSKHSDIPTSITVDNKQVTNTKDISNTFNNYFSNIAENILKDRKWESL